MKKPWKLPERAAALLRRYRIPALVLLLGVGLLLLPTGRKAEQPAAEPEPAARTEAALEARLETLLSAVEGAGRVRVLLTLEAGEETRYLSDETREVSGEETRVSGTTVLPGTGSSSEAPVAVQVLGPVYRGAVVVAEGADRAAVRLSLVNAVSSLTGLGTDHITVIKMK